MSDNTIKSEYARKLQTRVERLEKVIRWNLFALDLLASLGEFQSSNTKDRDPLLIFQITRKQVKQLLSFQGTGFFLVDEFDANFELMDVEPESLRDSIQKEVDALIENGTFAYAIKQNRPLVVKSLDSQKKLVLHVLGTQVRVRGMFVGIIGKDEDISNETALYTLSIMIQGTANSLESAALYKIMHDQNRDLEEKVHQRTLELEEKAKSLETEVSQRQKAEGSLAIAKKQTEEAFRAKVENVSKMSYEIRTQVHSILGHCEMIQESLKDLNKNKNLEDVKNIENASRTLLGLIENII